MVLCKCACANLILKANFNLINRTDLFICLHIMFQISIQYFKAQKVSVFGQNFCSVYFSMRNSYMKFQDDISFSNIIVAKFQGPKF